MSHNLVDTPSTFEKCPITWWTHQVDWLIANMLGVCLGGMWYDTEFKLSMYRTSGSPNKTAEAFLFHIPLGLQSLNSQEFIIIVPL